jgi:predicted PurR-regulated permease PerM
LAAWQLAYVLLLSFGGVLIAVLLRHVAMSICRLLPLPPGAGVGIVVLGLVALLVTFTVTAGPRIADQAGQLGATLANAAQELDVYLQDRDWGRFLIERLGQGAQNVQDFDLVGALTGTVSTLIGAAANVVVIVTVAIFLALDPGLYRRGALHLVPIPSRERAGEVLDSLGRGLWLWIVGQGIDMLFVGLAVGLGLWALGVPLPVPLAVIAGATNVVPYLGPFIGAAPAVLIAFAHNPTLAMWTALLFLVVQQIEGNVLQPVIQKRATALPPVLTILAVVGFGVLFGLVGVLVATPLLLVILITVRMLYVEDALGDRGEDERDGG